MQRVRERRFKQKSKDLTAELTADMDHIVVSSWGPPARKGSRAVD
jgi:hypothetical protein